MNNKLFFGFVILFVFVVSLILQIFAWQEIAASDHPAKKEDITTQYAMAGFCTGITFYSLLLAIVLLIAGYKEENQKRLHFPIEGYHRGNLK